ncbi:MAG: hypothetical protein WA539_08540 [Candidatus Sulfotelmatobacter sp.]
MEASADEGSAACPSCDGHEDAEGPARATGTSDAIIKITNDAYRLNK